jgi:hypothetical protein
MVKCDNRQQLLKYTHLNACMHSHVRASHTRTVASEDAEMTWLPSALQIASLTYDVWPRISFNIFPLLSPCTRTVPSKEPLSTCSQTKHDVKARHSAHVSQLMALLKLSAHMGAHPTCTSC